MMISIHSGVDPKKIKKNKSTPFRRIKQKEVIKKLGKRDSRCDKKEWFERIIKKQSLISDNTQKQFEGNEKTNKWC